MHEEYVVSFPRCKKFLRCNIMCQFELGSLLSIVCFFKLELELEHGTPCSHHQDKIRENFPSLVRE